jgi:hypothetical protein
LLDKNSHPVYINTQEARMPKQFFNAHGKIYRVDDKTGVIQRVTFEDIDNNTQEAKELIALLAATSTARLTDEVD